MRENINLLKIDPYSKKENYQKVRLVVLANYRDRKEKYFRHFIALDYASGNIVKLVCRVNIDCTKAECIPYNEELLSGCEKNDVVEVEIETLGNQLGYKTCCYDSNSIKILGKSDVVKLRKKMLDIGVMDFCQTFQQVFGNMLSDLRYIDGYFFLVNFSNSKIIEHRDKPGCYQLLVHRKGKNVYIYIKDSTFVPEVGQYFVGVALVHIVKRALYAYSLFGYQQTREKLDQSKRRQKPSVLIQKDDSEETDNLCVEDQIEEEVDREIKRMHQPDGVSESFEEAFGEEDTGDNHEVSGTDGLEIDPFADDEDEDEGDDDLLKRWLAEDIRKETLADPQFAIIKQIRK